MALAFGSAHRLDRILVNTREIVGGSGENAAVLRAENMISALQTAAALYNYYGGDGSEITYQDRADINILQSELIATTAALILMKTALDYYKDDVVRGKGGPAEFQFRTDKVKYLEDMIAELRKRENDLKGQLGFIVEGQKFNLNQYKKVRACEDPDDDYCCPPYRGIGGPVEIG